MRLLWCYIFQILGLVFASLSGISRNRKMIFFLILLANVSSILVMILADRYDGAASAVVISLRTFLFMYREKFKGNGIFWLCFLTQAAVGVLAWQSPLSILAMAAPLVLSATMWFGDVNVVKYGTIFSDLCWTVFDMASGIYVEGARDLVGVASNVVGLIRGRGENRTPDPE